MQIQIQNTSSKVTDAQVTALIPSLQKQVDNELLDVWGVRADLKFISNQSFQDGPDVYHCIIKDVADDPRDLGFHVYYPQNIPEARIFMDVVTTYSAEISTVLSHEILEMLVDPYTNRPAPANSSYGVEICDPVSDNFYYIDGVLVSNFVTPLYYCFQTRSTTYDHNQQLKGPLPALLPGGIVWELNAPNAMWVAHAAARANGRLNWRAAHAGRSVWRASQTAATNHPPPP